MALLPGIRVDNGLIKAAQSRYRNPKWIERCQSSMFSGLTNSGSKPLKRFSVGPASDHSSCSPAGCNVDSTVTEPTHDFERWTEPLQELAVLVRWWQ